MNNVYYALINVYNETGDCYDREVKRFFNSVKKEDLLILKDW